MLIILGQSIPGLGWKRTYAVSLGFQGGVGGGGFIQSLDVSELTIKKHLMDLSMVFFNFFLYGQVWKNPSTPLEIRMPLN